MHITHPYIYVFSFLIVAGLFFSLPTFKFIDDSSSPERNTPLDSIRYFLASFVFFSHAFFLRDIVLKGTWTGHTSPEIAYLAQIGVTVFFMITGYLFWNIVKKEHIDWVDLYKNRIFRITPVLFFNNLFIAAIIFYITTTLPNGNFIKWFDIINNNLSDYSAYTPTWSLTAGVRWTLVYEWGFYFSLPILALLNKKPFETVLGLLFISIYAADYLNPKIPFNFMSMFFFGMLISELSSKINTSTLILDILFVVVILIIFTMNPTVYVTSSILNPLLAIAVFCLSKGATIFGLLNIKGFKRLGQASYSIYIMHASVIFIIYKVANKFNLLTENSSSICVSILSFTIVLFVSTLTYAIIERPFMRFGKKLKIKPYESTAEMQARSP
ncbi:acyltransferase [Aeromonas veronii]|uniref:acyltransferase family protein n=1 Tax=Aeromonas veronii TaxID=654 RepID=UPI0031FC395A